MTSLCGFDILLARASILLVRPHKIVCAEVRTCFGTVVEVLGANYLSKLNFFYLYITVVGISFFLKSSHLLFFNLYITLLDMLGQERY